MMYIEEFRRADCRTTHSSLLCSKALVLPMYNDKEIYLDMDEIRHSGLGEV